MPERIIVSVETADQTALRELPADEKARFVADFREAILSPVAVVFAPPGRRINLLHYGESAPPAAPLKLADVTARMQPAEVPVAEVRHEEPRRRAK